MEIASIAILIALSAFFSSSETSITSVNPYKLRQLVDDGVRNSRKLQYLTDNISKTLSAILIGNNVVNITASSLATVVFVDYFGSRGVGISTIVMTLLVLTFGEIIPKSLAKVNTLKTALNFSPYIYFLVKILTPFTAFFNFITDQLTKNSEEEKMTEDDLITILNVSHEEGIIKDDQREMMENVFGIAESQAKDTMTNRTSIVAIDIETGYDELLDLISANHFSRYPVYGENIDDIKGILYVRDLVGIKPSEFDLEKLMRPAFFQYESKNNFMLLSELKKRKISMAIILDEYGGTSGIVTVEDIVEEIVGDIDDEYDEVQHNIRKIQDNIYSIDADTELDLINDNLDIELISDEFESLGGFVSGIADKFPKVGEVFNYENCEFTIERANPKKIDRIRLKIKR